MIPARVFMIVPSLSPDRMVLAPTVTLVLGNPGAMTIGAYA
jgi:hypothetical protein